MAIDYRELLVKYMAHVIDREGVSFTREWEQADWVSAEEWAELIAIAESVQGQG